MARSVTERTILFSAPINPATANEFIAILASLAKEDVTDLTIAMNSPGGQVISGVLLYNYMKSAPFTITTHNIGNVDSIANAVFLAGKHRRACAPATFMFHGIGFDGNASERLEEKNLQAKLDTVHADHKRISEVIASRTNLSVEQGMELFKEQKTRDATWAKEKGIIHEIADFTFPAAGGLQLFLK